MIISHTTTSSDSEDKESVRNFPSKTTIIGTSEDYSAAAEKTWTLDDGIIIGLTFVLSHLLIIFESKNLYTLVFYSQRVRPRLK